MQKLGMLQAFAQLAETEDATFVHPQGSEDQARLIKMRILAEKPVNLYLIPVDYDYEFVDENGKKGRVTAHHDEDEFIQFLTHVEPGMEQLEFYWKGSFCLRLMGGNIWLDTYDNTAFNVESVDDVSFARLWEREERDPRILEMERLARHNSRLLDQQRAEDLRLYEERMAALEAKYQQNVNPPANAANPVQPVGSDESTTAPPAVDAKANPPAESGTGGNA
ncbi:hypothetical protein [Flyfo microvirus Tbat2_43]|nr:hypothetical protein [Flyfo microvirus Tbat2_43]